MPVDIFDVETGKNTSEWEDVDEGFRQDVEQFDGLTSMTADVVAQAMKRLARIDATIAGINTSAKAEIDAVQRQRDRMVASENRKKAYLERMVLPQMESFLKAELEGKKKRSFDTLYGRLQLRHENTKLKVADKAAALEWAIANLQGAVQRKIVESVPDETLKAHFKETGEVPDGCEIIPEQDKFYITTVDKQVEG